MKVPDIAAVTQQSAGHHEIAHRMDSRHPVLEHQSGKLLCAAVEKNVGPDNEPANVQSGQLRKCGIRFRARCWRSENEVAIVSGRGPPSLSLPFRQLWDWQD